MPSPDSRLQALLDREAIRDCLARYCRGADRCDAELMRSAFWPEATDSHGMPGREPVNAHHFIERVMPKLQRMDQTAHFIGNQLIRAAGGEAAVETYYQAYHRVRDEHGAARDIVTAGRYLDRMEKRGNEWRVRERVVVVDWFREYDDSADWQRGTFGGPCAMGARGAADASHALFAAFSAPRDE